MDLTKIKPHVVSEGLEDKIFLFYGEPGSRKTTVASQFKNSILAGFEIGYKFINGVIAQPITSWADFKEFLRALKKPETKEYYDTVIIDTVTIAYSMCSKYVCDRLNISDPGDAGFGKGWRAIRREFEEAILSIPRMGYGVVLIAHANEMEDQGSIQAKVDIDKRPAAIIKGLADFILYTRKEYRDDVENPGNEDITVYAYSDLPTIETKSRSRYFTPKFEFTYENLKKEMAAAIEKQKKVEGITTSSEPTVSYEKPVEDFETLQNKTRALAEELISLGYQNKVASIILESLPEGISDATPAVRDQLEVVYQSLADLKAFS